MAAARASTPRSSARSSATSSATGSATSSPASTSRRRRVRRQRLRDRARLLLPDHRLADRARRVRRPGPADARQADHGAADDHSANVGFGQVLQVHPRPQGRRPAVPGRHADLLLHRRPAGDRDQDRAAVADVSRHEPDHLPRGGRRARDHDDDDDDLGHPRPVRQLPGADHDRLEAGRVPADRGAVLLAHPLRLPDPAVELPAAAGSRPAGPATRRCPSRPARAWTRTRSRSA